MPPCTSLQLYNVKGPATLYHTGRAAYWLRASFHLQDEEREQKVGREKPKSERRP